MAHSSALETLIDLAQRASDDAAKRLGEALKQVEEAQQKLEMLVGYREEYGRKLEAAQIAGITPSAYHNFVAFIGKLDSALSGQREILKHAQYKAGIERSQWQECERKRLSYRTLNERAAREALKLENRRDQKLMDDFAARSARLRA